jgi:hypothetical protein
MNRIDVKRYTRDTRYRFDDVTHDDVIICIKYYEMHHY